MASNYAFALDLDLLPLPGKTVGSQPNSVFQFEATDGARWIATADLGSARVSLFQIAGVDGIVDDQATITSNALITKAVGTNPYFLLQFQATDGTRWIATADFGSARVSLFQIAGTDGIVDDQATITANPLITKTVGTQPISVFQFEAPNGTRWLATADYGSNRVSLFQIAGVDGIVYDQATITSNALITKTVGTQPISIFQFQVANGTRWIATADFASARVSLFQIAGIDGIVYDQATITSNALITKTVGSQPRSIFQFEATDGARWIATADRGSARVSLFQIAGIDGIVYDQATITSNALITKTVGTQPSSAFQFEAPNGTRWIATAGYGSNRVSLFQIAGIDGIVYDQATITANPLITKTVGTPTSVFHFEATDGARWIAIASNHGGLYLFQIAAVGGFSLAPNTLTNFSISIPASLIQPFNVAEVTSLLDYFNFSAGISPVLLSSFAYTFDFDDSGTIGSGSTLRLTTATSDITNSSGITVASGATVRLGKKATYTVDFFFQNGSTVEVFPDSDRSDATLDLTNCTFAATTTVNATSSTATVLAPSGSNITAGAGVTIQEPVADTSVTGLIAGSRVQIYNETTDEEVFNDEVAGTSHTESYTLDDGDVLRLRVAKIGYEAYEVGAVYSGSTGASWLVSQVANAIYVANDIDGSTIEKFVADYDNDQVDLQVASDFTAAEFYAWWCYNMTTEDGIANFFGGITALDQANYRSNTATVDVMFDNLTTSNKKQSDSARIFRDDGTYPVYDPTTGGGGVQVNWQIPVYIVGTASALTPSESAKLMGLDTTNLDAAVTTRLAADGYTAPDNTSIASILVDTNELQTNQGNWITATGFSTFDPTTDVVAHVTLVDTTTTNTDMRGTDGSVTSLSGIATSAEIADLNNFNPATDTVAHVTLVDTVTTNTDMRGTNSALLAASYTAPDNASIASILADTNELQLNQGNWVTATGFSTFNPATDVVAHVTLVDTTTTNTDMRGTDSALLATSYTAPDNASITAIKAKTDNLTFTGTDIKATLDGELVTTDTASRNASKADVSALALEATAQAASSKVDELKPNVALIPALL